MNRILEVFPEERVVSRGRWPARSPDRTVCDFLLWGALKGKVYSSYPKTIDELQTNISVAIAEITQQQLQATFQNMLRRPDMCLQVGGGCFQHLL
jgi:hypothetical protein